MLWVFLSCLYFNKNKLHVSADEEECVQITIPVRNHLMKCFPCSINSHCCSDTDGPSCPLVLLLLTMWAERSYVTLLSDP